MLIFEELLPLLGGRSHADAACPACSPYRKKPHQRLKVLRLWPFHGGISFICQHCHEQGVAWPGGQRPREVDWQQMEAERQRRAEHERRDRERRTHDAERLLRAGDPDDRLIDRYFSQRGLDVPEAARRQMRLHPNCPFGEDGTWPAILMPFRSIETLGMTGVHRIAVHPDGHGVAIDGRKLKKSLGVVKGSAMMWRRVGAMVTLCEGLETAFAVEMGGLHEGGAIFAMSGTAGIAGLEPIDGVHRLIIAADHDFKDSKGKRAGLAAAKACARLWKDNAMVDIVWPDDEGKDWADVYQRAP